MPDAATQQTSPPEWIQELSRLIDAGELDTYLDRYYADDARDGVRLVSSGSREGSAARGMIRERLEEIAAQQGAA